jgi:hypothetical protein
MFAAKLIRLAQPLFLVGAFMVLCQLASTALAMCVYNNMDVEIEVDFLCGTFCENDWSIDPNGYNCRPATSGTLHVNKVCAGIYATSCTYLNNIDVEAHGYVVLSGTGGAGSTRSMCAFHEDDSLVGCVSFSYPSG